MDVQVGPASPSSKSPFRTFSSRYLSRSINFSNPSLQSLNAAQPIRLGSKMCFLKGLPQRLYVSPRASSIEPTLTRLPNTRNRLTGLENARQRLDEGVKSDRPTRRSIEQNLVDGRSQSVALNRRNPCQKVENHRGYADSRLNSWSSTALSCWVLVYDTRGPQVGISLARRAESLVGFFVQRRPEFS